MFNHAKLLEIISAYKKHFPVRWKDEMYKWEAIQHFQKHWDVNAENFLDMFMEATDKTSNLLANMNNYPRGMIKAFATADAEAVRGMFIDLFDESKNLAERIEQFQTSADELRVKYDDGTWRQHYQGENAITTYLWLRYPNKYYIYKYSEVRSFAKAVDSDFVPKKGGSIFNVEGGLKFYNDVRAIIKQDPEMDNLLQDGLKDSCYPDPEKVTMTIDVGFFVSRFYGQKAEETEVSWFPVDYSPNLSVDDYMSLLQDKDVFTEGSLQIMKRFMDYGGEATCTQLATKYGETKNFYNSGSSALARRVAEKTGCPILEKEEGSLKYWPILYLGRSAEKNVDGSYIWKLRDELKEALSKTDLSAVELFAKDQQSEENSTKAQKEENEPYTKEDFLSQVYMTEERYNTLVALLKNKKNLILQGAPGVGKTFAAKRLAYSMMGEKDDSRIEFIQFHQNYSYEDFIMGYKPQDEGFKLTNGIFYQFCMNAANHPDKEYFFIIDEINRGNMSKIFGELLMLIEKDYRGTKATLAYSGTAFSVPRNLYIIGMMNTADRSLAMIDYALRRRFSFYDMEPGFNSEGFKAYQASLQNETFNALIEQIIDLNREINADDSLGTGFRIGHSYFCGQEECTEEWMKSIVYYDIIPMLQEYWFDDRQKVQRWENLLIGVFND